MIENHRKTSHIEAKSEEEERGKLETDMRFDMKATHGWLIPMRDGGAIVDTQAPHQVVHSELGSNAAADNCYATGSSSGLTHGVTAIPIATITSSCSHHININIYSHPQPR